MTEVVQIGKAVLFVWLLAFGLWFLGWGIQPWLRHRYKRKIRASERVRFSSDVNTDMTGFQVKPNRWIYFALTAYWIGLIWVMSDPNGVLFGGFLFGSFVYLLLVLIKAYQNSRFQHLQSYMLTDKGAWVFPERLGAGIWKGGLREHCPWEGLDGYRVDGSYVQLVRDEEMVLQFEYAPYDYEALKQVLDELQVPRLDLSDRIWVSQLDERAFQQLEDEICEIGWNLLDLFQDELHQLNVRPEFGVMRNMPGDRLLEEHARSWLQLNLLDLQSGQPRASSTFPLWQSSGSVGFLIGLRGQEVVERLQRWVRDVLVEAAASEGEVVS